MEKTLQSDRTSAMTSTAVPRPRAALRAAAVLAAALAAARWLHGLAGEPWARVDVDAPATWLVSTPTEDVVAALLRLAALALCWWVAGSLLVGVAARMAGWRPGLALADGLSPGSLRRLADGLTGGTLLVASVLGPSASAFAAESGAPPAPASGAFSPPGAGPLVPPTTDTTPAAPPVVAPGGRDALVEVQPGDHLWGIARRAVGAARGVPIDGLTDDDVAPYWRRVVDVNRDRLRSGDPDLVLPGETVLLPEWP